MGIGYTLEQQHTRAGGVSNKINAGDSNSLCQLINRRISFPLSC